MFVYEILYPTLTNPASVAQNKKIKKIVIPFLVFIYLFLTEKYIWNIIYFLVQAQQNPAISYITEEQYANIGDSIDLNCAVHYSSGYPVSIKIYLRNKIKLLLFC